MDGTDGFKALAAHLLTKQIPKAVQEGSDHPLVEALVPLLTAALEAWYQGGAGFFFAATDYLNAATAARDGQAETVIKEESI